MGTVAQAVVAGGGHRASKAGTKVPEQRRDSGCGVALQKMCAVGLDAASQQESFVVGVGRYQKRQSEDLEGVVVNRLATNKVVVGFYEGILEFLQNGDVGEIEIGPLVRDQSVHSVSKRFT
mmetsp:Transcript_26719/g.58571  ORF Transcript_26719/g.58571 Transcript_26719/m.58571 type:complete len:121 (-) Transcript_26719:297-659(-)